jgi:hypothetical protein
MDVGAALLDLALGGNSPGIAVVGTGKNVGKTVAARAIASAAVVRGLAVGMTSIGRDGEAVDAGDAQAKPRLFLPPGTLLATARGVLPPTPAVELLDFSELQTAAGPLVYARVREPGYFELVGPPTASGVRTALDALRRLGATFVVLDGAIDRVAALAGGDEAIVVATGAASGSTVEGVADELRAMVARLATPAFDPTLASLEIEGGLTAAGAAALISAGERRQVVVRDPSQIAMSGRAFLGLTRRVTVRCRRPLRVVAATIASIGRESYLEPAALARAVAQACGLPAFDVYAGSCVAA